MLWRRQNESVKEDSAYSEGAFKRLFYYVQKMHINVDYLHEIRYNIRGINFRFNVAKELRLIV